MKIFKRIHLTGALKLYFGNRPNLVASILSPYVRPNNNTYYNSGPIQLHVTKMW